MSRKVTLTAGGAMVAIAVGVMVWNPADPAATTAPHDLGIDTAVQGALPADAWDGATWSGAVGNPPLFTCWQKGAELRMGLRSHPHYSMWGVPHPLESQGAISVFLYHETVDALPAETLPFWRGVPIGRETRRAGPFGWVYGGVRAFARWDVAADEWHDEGTLPSPVQGRIARKSVSLGGVRNADWLCQALVVVAGASETRAYASIPFYVRIR